MNINEVIQTKTQYILTLSPKEALILKQMIQNKSTEDEPLEVEQFRSTIWSYLPSLENLAKGANDGD